MNYLTKKEKFLTFYNKSSQLVFFLYERLHIFQDTDIILFLLFF